MARQRKKVNENPKGLGDTIENVLETTGIAKVAKWVFGEDCKCEERKQKLNELFPYNKPECLHEDEYEFLTWWFSETRNQMRPSEQLRILEIYNRTFHKNMQPTSCGSCLRDVLQKLKTLTDEYGK